MICDQYKSKDQPAVIWISGTGRIIIYGNGDGWGFVLMMIERFTYVSCYFMPNKRILDLQNKLEKLEDATGGVEGAFVVTAGIAWEMETRTQEKDTPEDG